MAVAALTPLSSVSAQAPSRICLSEAVLHGRLSNDRCLATTEDRSSHDGRLYSDKAPGLSLLELPSVAALSPGQPQGWAATDLRVWGVRVLSVGVGLLLAAFLVGRVSEGLAPGFGGIALVSFALGTLVAPLAATSYEHVPAGALALAAFLLAWRQRPALAGLVAGAAVLVEYECGIVVVVVAVYVAFRGRAALGRFIAGLVPAAVVLGGYDWAAFGAPWHLSYDYLASYYAGFQGRGLFGIGLPTGSGVIEVFAGPGGLLVISPILVMAALGLVQLGRSYRGEAIVAAAVAGLYVLGNCGYFQPYGGYSPGPRFLVAGLPFLALGLGPAFTRWPRLALLLAALSALPTMAVVVTWASGQAMSGSVWVELARIPADLGRSSIARALSANALSALGPGREWCAAIVGASALAAFLVAARSLPWGEIRASRSAMRRRPPRRTLVVGIACAYLILVSDVLAFTNYPYGDRPPRLALVALHTAISAPSSRASVGDEVNLTVTVVDDGPIGAADLSLRVALTPGLQLVGRPAYTLGSGCSGSSTLICNLGSLRSAGRDTATVYLGVRVTVPANQTVTASASAEGDRHGSSATFAITVAG